MPAEPRFDAPDPREVDTLAARRAFGRAAKTYDAAAALQREVSARMSARLAYVKIAPSSILDAGCGTGDAIGELALRFPGSRVTALDSAYPMLLVARDRVRGGRSLLRRLLPAGLAGAGRAPFFVAGDLVSLPFGGVTFDLVWSNLALHWVNDLPRAIAEMRRVLKVGGLFSFTTLGPDTLREVRKAFSGADGHTHTNRFADMHDIGDMLVEGGFADPVMDMEQLTLTYNDPAAMMRELLTRGATNSTRGRPRGLMGRRRWLRAMRALDGMKKDGRLPLSIEVVYGHAWKGEPRRTPEGLPIIKVQRP